MKKLIIILFVLYITSFKTQAQGNLQFNQVKLISISSTWSNFQYWLQNDTLITVPIGKVWKIESGICSTFSSGVLIDGRNLTVFPFWLPSGTYTLSCSVNQNYSNNSNNIPKATISAIEFNITQ